MEKQSPGSGGGVTTSSVNLEKMSAQVINGGSPDSTTPKPQGDAPSPPPSSAPEGGTAPNMYSLKWNTQLLSLQRSLANLWDSGIGTDAVLLCQGTPLPVHKIVLTAASPYVAAVVQVSKKNANFAISGISQ